MAAQLAGEGDGARNNAIMYQGLKEHYGLDEKALRFYRTHEEADADHGSLTEVIIRRYITTPELKAQARAIVQRKIELLWDMWGSYQYF
jgi:pyrroloquinoline quinone (PQQ) biosynthesis protein C